MNHIQYTVTMSCSQVEYTNFRFFFQFFQCFYMTYSQVYYMDVITYTGSVRSIIIITEDSQTFQFTDGNLCNIWKQIVRDSFRIIPSLSRSFLLSVHPYILAKTHYQSID